MAFVFREERLKDLKNMASLLPGPGQYLPITNTKIVKSNIGVAPFESNVERYKNENKSKDNFPGPGNYYKNLFDEKVKRDKNSAKIKSSSQAENILQDKYLSKTGNFFKTKYNLNKTKEVLGFYVKEKRFKNDKNNNSPGPFEYFKEAKKDKLYHTLRYNESLCKNKFKIISKKLCPPSIPFKDIGFDIQKDNSLVKLENPNLFLTFRGDKSDSVGPGSYDLDDPKIWLKSGTSWSKMRGRNNSYINSSNNSINTTRPQTSVMIQKSFRTNQTNLIRSVTMKMIKDTRDKRKLNAVQVKKNIKEEIQKARNKNKMPLLVNECSKQIEDFNNRQSPGPGYYIDISKESCFYKRSIPYPEFKQFFGSNNDRFPKSKSVDDISPAYYFYNNIYYDSAFNNGKILEYFDKNKNKPFSSRTQRFGDNIDKKEITPGPGSYEPKLKKEIEQNKFGNEYNSFNLRQAKYNVNSINEKWKMNIPGPGAYINPYSGTGIRNTVFIKGLYMDVRKGKEYLRQRSKNCKKIMKNCNSTEFKFYNSGEVLSIEYKNKKISKKYNLKKQLNIAFNSNIKKEKNLDVLKSNLGPGIYYNEPNNKGICIRSPFQSKTIRTKKIISNSISGPGSYDSQNYFDWNIKTYNVSFL